MVPNRSSRLPAWRSLFLMFSMVTLLGACISRYQEIIPDSLRFVWDPSIAAPLMQTSLTLEELLSQVDTSDLVGVNTDGVISFYFEQEVSSQYARELYNIPDQSFSENIPTQPSVVSPIPIDTTITFSEQFELDITTDQGERLDSILLRTGDLFTQITVYNPSVRGQIELVIPALRDNNRDTVIQNFSWTGATGADVTVSSTSTLDSSSLALNNPAGDRNKFIFIANVSLFYENATVIGGSSADILFNLTNLDWKAVFGDLRSRTVPTAAGTVPFGVFGDVTQGVFTLSDPEMRLILNNSFGIPIALDFSSMSATDRDGNVVPLSGDIVTNQQNINYPTFEQFGETISDTLFINNTNSNISNLLEILPQRLSYDVSGAVNPAGESNNFVMDSSRITGALEVEVPLSGTINGLSYESYFNYNLDSIDLAVQTAGLVITTTNTLPLDLSVYLEVLDADSVVLDTLVNEGQLITAAPVDGSGNVNLNDPPAPTTKTIEVDRTGLDALAGGSIIRLILSVSTTNGGTESINLKPEYGIDVQVGIISDLQIEFDVPLGGGN